MLLNQSSYYQNPNLATPQKSFSSSHSRDELRRGFTEKPFQNMQLSTQLLPSKSLFEDNVPDCEPELEKTIDPIEESISVEQIVHHIPSSQIGWRNTSSPLLKCKSDSYQISTQPISTQPSIRPSAQATPLSKIELVLDFEGLSKKINNGSIRPPGMQSTLNQPYSNRSTYFREKLESLKSEDRLSTPNCKSMKGNILSEVSPLTQDSKLRIETNVSNSPDIHSPYSQKKELSKSVHISDFSKHSFYKTTSQINYGPSPTKSPRKLYSLNKPTSSTKTNAFNYSKSTITNFINADIFNDAQNWLKETFMKDQPKRFKCTCDGIGASPKTCHRALEWLYRQYKPTEFDYLKRTYEKIVSDKRLTELKHLRQIQKDTYRTFPSYPLFKANAEGLQTLERLLETFAKYDPNIGYVQGMNFLAGSLLYHAEEYLAFWVLVTIFETLEMRDIFLPGLPGLSKHCQIIDMLIFNYLPKVYSKLCEFGIKAEMYASEWILTLFSSLAPIEDMGLIYDLLLEHGWPFFYKLILKFLDSLTKEIEKQSDLGELLVLLKSQNYLLKNTHKSIFNFSGGWKDLCKKAQEFDLDLNFIYEMHLQFDADKLWFKTSA